jgi:hypothetical protein
VKCGIYDNVHTRRIRVNIYVILLLVNWKLEGTNVNEIHQNIL